jgi:YVTN family beta-propeller protein
MRSEMSSARLSIGWIILAGALIVGANSSAQTPSPALLVVTKDGNALDIVDPAAKKVVGRVPVGNGPHEVAVSSDGSLAFVSNFGGHDRRIHPSTSISVIDLRTQKELRKVEVGPLPHGVVFLDGKLYYTVGGYKLLGRYDPFSNQIDWLLGTGQNGVHNIVFTKDMNKIFTSNSGSNTVSVFERSGNPPDWNQTVIPVGKAPQSLDISPDGKEVWTGHGEEGSISIIDVAAGKLLQTLDVQGAEKGISKVKFASDGKRAFVCNFGNDLVTVIDVAERKQITKINLGHRPLGILMAPDGRHAYVSVGGDNDVVILDLKTLEVLGRIPTGKEPDGMAWVERRD